MIHQHQRQHRSAIGVARRPTRIVAPRGNHIDGLALRRWSAGTVMLDVGFSARLTTMS